MELYEWCIRAEMIERPSPLPSLQTLAAKRVAVMICSIPRVKDKVFCPLRLLDLAGDKFGLKSKVCRNTMMKSEVSNVLSNLGLTKVCQQMVASCFPMVAREMIKWWRQLENCFTCESGYCAEMVNDMLFTFDKRGAAEQLMKDERLGAVPRFRIACMFMLIDDIGHTWNQMTNYERTEVQHMKCPDLAQLWSQHLMYGKVRDVFSGHKPDVRGRFWDATLERALEVESDVAVHFWWLMLNHSTRDLRTVHVAEEILEKIYREYKNPFFGFCLFGIYADIFCFLYTKMTYSLKRNFLERIAENEFTRLELSKMFMDNYFHDVVLLNLARVVWEVSPEPDGSSRYLSSILHYLSLKCFASDGQDSRCEYRSVAHDVWSRSPDHVKRAFFENKNGLKSCNTDLDREISKFVLKDATREETIKLFFSTKEQSGMILQVFENHSKTSADHYLRHCVLDDSEKREYLKREIELFPLKSDDLKTLDRFDDYMHYCLQFEDKMQKEELKKMHVYERRDEICMVLIWAHKWEDADSFLQQIVSSPEDILAFKKALFERSGRDIHCHLIKMDKRQTLEKCFEWFQLSPDEITTLKKECFLNHRPTLMWFRSLVLNEEIEKWVAIHSFVEWHLPDHEQAKKFEEALQQRVADSNGVANPESDGVDEWQNLIWELIDE